MQKFATLFKRKFCNCFDQFSDRQFSEISHAKLKFSKILLHVFLISHAFSQLSVAIAFP